MGQPDDDNILNPVPKGRNKNKDQPETDED